MLKRAGGNPLTTLFPCPGFCFATAQMGRIHRTINFQGKFHPCSRSPHKQTSPSVQDPQPPSPSLGSSRSWGGSRTQRVDGVVTSGHPPSLHSSAPSPAQPSPALEIRWSQGRPVLMETSRLGCLYAPSSCELPTHPWLSSELHAALQLDLPQHSAALGNSK